MTRSTAVEFRGLLMAVTIDHDSGYDRDTNSHEIDWHFSDLTPDEHEALNITDEEEEAIFNELAALEPLRFDDDYF